MPAAASSCHWLTPAVPAAIAMLRMPAVPSAFDRDPPRPGRACLARLIGVDGEVADEVVLWSLDDGYLEVCTHGGPGVRQRVGQALLGHGLSVGEDAGPEDRVWAALAAAPCPAACDWLLKQGLAEPPFPAAWLRRLPVVVIAGPVNAGKSSLLNAWCGFDRALVSPEPGTTRDLVSAEVLVDGWRLRLIDTAGLRSTQCDLEAAGQALARQACAQADLVLRLHPATSPAPGPTHEDLLVYSKVDLAAAPAEALAWAAPAFIGEAAAQRLLHRLEQAVLARLGMTGSR